jgi:tetratricopeptide (TPR) repeat protein
LLVSALLAGSALFAAALVTGSRELDHIGFYDEGLSHLKNGRHEEAIESFSHSLEVEEKFAPALIARARTKEARGHEDKRDFTSALDDYQIAYQLTQEPALKAEMAYCLGKLNSYLEAIELLNEAIEGGFETAEVFNNLGYCQMKTTYYDDAEKNLTKALELNPTLQAPWYNRALNGLNRSEACHVPIPQTAVNNIQKARETGKDGPMLLYYAAAIWDRLPSKSPHRHATILELLEKSLEMGLDSNVLIGQSPRFQELRNTPEFNALVGQPRPARRVPFRPHLLQVDSTPPSIASSK